MESAQWHGKAGTGLQVPYSLSYHENKDLLHVAFLESPDILSAPKALSSSPHCPQCRSCHHKDTVQTPSSLWSMVSVGWFSMAAYLPSLMCGFSFLPSCRICTFTHSSISRLPSIHFSRPLCTPVLPSLYPSPVMYILAWCPAAA